MRALHPSTVAPDAQALMCVSIAHLCLTIFWIPDIVSF